MSDLKYWVISVPSKPSREGAFSTIQQVTSQLATSAKFSIPNDLRVGTLDSLMSMSDELVKVDHMIEHTAKKIGQQIYSLKPEKPQSGTIFLTIGGEPLSDYIQRFHWDAARYSVRLSVSELTNKFQEKVSAIEEEYRQKITDYTNISHAVTQYERSLKANLTIRDLTDIIDVDDIIESKLLTTLFIVCNKQQEKEWESVYESFKAVPKNDDEEKQKKNVPAVEYVVPRSCKRITEEGDQCLLCVTLLKKFKEDFKQEAISHRVTVREVTIDKENYQSGNERYEEMKKEMKQKQNKLHIWCQTNFADVFTAWTHLKALRIHVESILRFGLPAEYVAAVVKPLKTSHEKKLRSALEVPFAEHASVHMQDMSEDVPGFTHEKLYPYVYMEMNLNYCRE